ncbi:MAG: phosphoenolpyruvate carboxykinase (ATP), partial [Flavobacteriaceae bacterium]|nr:phosphoenolpyruvate carboxykinase (ATP) [Flavobacteriaceae bacterium]
MSLSPSANFLTSIKRLNLKTDNIHYQLSPEELQDITTGKGMGREASSGALAVNTGEFTGRSPKDRF